MPDTRYTTFRRRTRTGRVFATRWLGWDCTTGRTTVPPALDGLPRPWDEITNTPRHYGLHATIKPPFRLAEGVTLADLLTACAAFCATTRPVRLDGLKLTTLGRFLALRPVGDETALNALAARCVRDLEPFRAPLTAEERARRAAGLRPDLIRTLDRWGYPHVMEAFRFHITLTGPPEAKGARSRARGARPASDPTLATPLHPRRTGTGRRRREWVLPQPPPLSPVRLTRQGANSHPLHRRHRAAYLPDPTSSSCCKYSGGAGAEPPHRSDWRSQSETPESVPRPRARVIPAATDP
ncbi:DUF1045 domain-containing protein [Jhaorihella thermophila]